jgi:hypothetical protein
LRVLKLVATKYTINKDTLDVGLLLFGVIKSV